MSGTVRKVPTCPALPSRAESLSCPAPPRRPPPPWRSYNVSSTVQKVRAELVRMAIERVDMGLNEWEKALISGGTRVVDACE